MLVERSYRPKDYENKIKKAFTKRIMPDDVMIHLGDVTFGADVDFSKWGKSRILIKGNHDSHGDAFYLSLGFTSVCNGLILEKYGKVIYFSHEPKEIWHGVDYNVHGHTHGDSGLMGYYRFYDPIKNIEIALENTNYEPVCLEKLIFEQ
jgi:calcineurin-like phosphoesterase family protein